MAFIDNLLTLMSASTSAIGLVLLTGTVTLENLPVDFDTNKNYVVFSYKLSESLDTLSTKEILQYYSLSVQVVGKEITDVIDISNLLHPYLLAYTDDKISDIYFNDEELNTNTEKEVYYKVLNFQITYNN